MQQKVSEARKTFQMTEWQTLSEPTVSPWLWLDNDGVSSGASSQSLKRSARDEGHLLIR